MPPRAAATHRIGHAMRRVQHRSRSDTPALARVVKVCPSAPLAVSSQRCVPQCQGFNAKAALPPEEVLSVALRGQRGGGGAGGGSSQHRRCRRAKLLALPVASPTLIVCKRATCCCRQHVAASGCRRCWLGPAAGSTVVCSSDQFGCLFKPEAAAA